MTSYGLGGVAMLVASFQAKGLLRLLLRLGAVLSVADVAFMLGTSART